MTAFDWEQWLLESDPWNHNNQQTTQPTESENDMPDFDFSEDRYCGYCGLTQQIRNSDGELQGAYCYDCAEYWRCERCTYGGDSFQCDACYENEYMDSDDCNCSDCREYRGDYGDNGEPTITQVMNYSYRPRFIPKGDPNDTITMGVELEWGGYPTAILRVIDGLRGTILNSTNLGNVSEALEHLYCKSDCSIDEVSDKGGVEVISHPMTLAYARKYPFTKLLNDMAEVAETDEGLGMHVHVSRDAFLNGKGETDTAHQFRWLMFFYRNIANMEKIGRRSSDRWAAFRTPRKSELRIKASAKKVNGALMCDCKTEGYRSQHYANDHFWDRYVAINVQNAATFELRFPMSTLDPQEFYATLEMVHASVQYTRHLTARQVRQGALSWSAFTSWAARRNYRALVSLVSN